MDKMPIIESEEGMMADLMEVMEELSNGKGEDGETGDCAYVIIKKRAED